MKILEIKNIHRSFGGVKALSNVHLSVDCGEIVGLIGPNGSGKTTLFNCISGFLNPDMGEILLQGRSITNLKPHQIARRGVRRSFQIARIFPELNVLKNLLVAQSHVHEKLYSVFRGHDKRIVEKALELLEFVDLIDLRFHMGNELSYGQQKLLELARTLLTTPKIVLLDEPTAGVNPALIKKITAKLEEANERLGVTFFLIEHNMEVVMGIAHRVYGLNNGEVIAEGKPSEVRSNHKLIEAYLGD